MEKNIIRRTGLFAGCVALSLLFAQTIQISGTVKDSETANVIEGAIVSLSGAGISDTTDAQGAFALSGGEVSIGRSGVIAHPALTGTGAMTFNLDAEKNVSVIVRSVRGEELFKIEKRLGTGSHELTIPIRDPGVLLYEVHVGKHTYYLRQISLHANGAGRPAFIQTAAGTARSLGKRTQEVDTLHVSHPDYISGSLPITNYMTSGLEIGLTEKSTSGYGRKDSNMVLPDPDGQPGAADRPLKVFIMAGQSNMLGYGKIDDLLGMATTQENLSHMVDDQGNWIERKDVYEIHAMTGSVQKKGYLLPSTLHKGFGVDFQFGHIMGLIHDEQVLLLKTAIGNRSLAWDILPPGSERYTVNGKTYAGYGDHPSDTTLPRSNYEWDGKFNPWYGGLVYDQYRDDAKMVLEDLKTHFPDYNEAQGYEIAGFVWFQGAKDSYDDVHSSRYEVNLVQLIKEFRKTHNAPDAKFVCATKTQNGGATGNLKTIADAQLAVSGDKGNYPEFAGNVLTTDSDGYNPAGSPNSHYDGDAEFLYLVGNALGWAMAELLEE